MQGDPQSILSSTTLFVGDLSVTCTEEALYQAFSEVGTPNEVRIIRTRRNASLGYAFVTMSTPESATKAIQQLNGQNLNGRRLRIGFASEVDQKKPPSVSTLNPSAHSWQQLDSQGTVRGTSRAYVPNFMQQLAPSPVLPAAPPNHPLVTSDTDSSLLSAQINSQQASHDHSNSVYFKFFMAKASPGSTITDEGIIRDFFVSNCGPDCVSDVSIRRIAEEGVS